jgi:hypothetical protein
MQPAYWQLPVELSSEKVLFHAGWCTPYVTVSFEKQSENEMLREM